MAFLVLMAAAFPLSVVAVVVAAVHDEVSWWRFRKKNGIE
jgi:hypothetical protein